MNHVSFPNTYLTLAKYYEGEYSGERTHQQTQRIS